MSLQVFGIELRYTCARCQNREESNPDYNFYDDGGFIYTPSSTIWAGGRSYASITAAVWGFVTAGVGTGDPRMQDALGWLENNYHIDQNYPIGNQFLYYYLYCLAKAYVLTDISTVDGHDWYEEMLEFLIDQQQEDGHCARDLSLARAARLSLCSCGIKDCSHE